MEIQEEKFGKEAKLFKLKNDNGVEMAVSDFGARIVSLKAPIDGGMRELVLGFDSAEEYVEKDSFIGASIGRFAGRIKHGIFSIDDQKYQVAIDGETGHSLHGGYGFDKYLWDSTIMEAQNRVSVEFNLKSYDGDEGFPGNLHVKVKYTLTNENEWVLDYYADTDQKTIYNPTNHVYFNLTGSPVHSIDEHLLQLKSNQYIEIDEEVIPTGRILPVENTMYDFTKEKKMSELFKQARKEKSSIDGLDHPFLLENEMAQALLMAPDKRVAIEMTTDFSAVVIFTANFGETGPEMRNAKLADHGGITLETQEPPGVTDYPEWGDIFVEPGKTMHKQTIYKIKLFN